MVDVRDISTGNFQGNIVLVYEDKPTNNKIVEILKSKKVFEGKRTESDSYIGCRSSV